MRRKTPTMKRIEARIGKLLEEDLRDLGPIPMEELACRWGVAPRTLYHWLPRLGAVTEPKTYAVLED